MAFERILCAVDFSPDSLRAFHVALDLAKHDGAALHVVHVVEAERVLPEFPPAGEMVRTTVGIMAEANRAMEVLLASAKGKLSGVALTSEVTPGRAFEEIPARARDRRSDLIVLGANGATSLEDAIIGGTAENVMNEATCSVLIAREPARRRVA